MLDRTRHPQFESTIHLPAAGPGAPKNDVICRVVTVNGHRMHLQSPQAIPASVPLSVEHDDALYLGEAVHCLALGDIYEVDIEVEQVLTGLQSLMSLAARLLDEQNTALQGTPAGRRQRLAEAFSQAGDAVEAHAAETWSEIALLSRPCAAKSVE